MNKRGQLCYLSPEEIKVAPGINSREDWGEDFEDFKASIVEFGVIQPILVRPTDSGYQLIAGKRRHRAASGAGLDAIPCHVLPLDDPEAIEHAIIENLKRKDFQPIEEACAFEFLLEKGYTTQRISERVGVSRCLVGRRLGLLALPPDEIAALRDGTMGIKKAEKLAEGLRWAKSSRDLIKDPASPVASFLEGEEALAVYDSDAGQVSGESGLVDMDSCPCKNELTAEADATKTWRDLLAGSDSGSVICITRILLPTGEKLEAVSRRDAREFVKDNIKGHLRPRVSSLGHAVRERTELEEMTESQSAAMFLNEIRRMNDEDFLSSVPPAALQSLSRSSLEFFAMRYGMEDFQKASNEQIVLSLLGLMGALDDFAASRVLCEALLCVVSDRDGAPLLEHAASRGFAERVDVDEIKVRARESATRELKAG